MCGIAGFSGVDQGLLEKVAGAISHRGPDATGLFSHESLVSFAHTRLSIVDLHERSDQPMRYTDNGRTFVLVFNGEIYNFQELRKTLVEEGCRFQTQGDSEVILAAYARWGEQCVRRFNGMWAFAIFDEREQKLFLSRDRFGKKPLYYHASDAHFIFASEVKALLQAPYVSRAADGENVADYLNFGLIGHNARTFFRAVQQLPAGSNGVLDLRTQRWSVTPYYSLPSITNQASDDDIRDLLRAAVRRRLISDVPICLSLSGGVDSSSIAAMIADVHDGRMVAFTTTSENGAGDETANVSKLLSEYPQFELIKVPVGASDLEATLKRIVYHMDAPFIYDSPFVRWKIAEAIHQHGFKVSVTGEGADELLGGYRVASHLFLLDLLRSKKLPRLALELAFTLRQPDWRPILSQFVAQFIKSRQGRVRDYLLWNARSMGCRVAAGDPGAALQEHDITLKEKLHTETRTFFLPYLLSCNDKMYMAHAVEARAPFLDVEVAEQLLGIATERLISRGIRKYPLRHAMRGRVPSSVLFDRNKIGFASPMRAQLATARTKVWVSEMFRDARSSAFLDPRTFLDAYQAFPSGTEVNDFALHAINLEIWMRQFDVTAA
jgi:asparagine synthase (glutamine-hydrolysing)